MKLTFIGAAHEVTGSTHFLEVNGTYMLIDCGMEQGTSFYENAKLPAEEAMIDYVFLTHAHVDHSGMLPGLYAKGFRGKVFATEATADLCSIMLRDCAHIQMQEAEWKNRKAKRHSGIEPHEPIYTMEDADGVIKRLVPCEYGRIIDICEGVRIRFTDVGHLLGSASIEVWLTENGVTKKIVFSGDLGNKNQPIIKDPMKTEEADYVVVESTYGDRIHSDTRPDYVAELTEVMQKTFDAGGNVVIPSFAVGRTQEMLYFLRQIKAEQRVKGHGNFPVYVDSPLAVDATDIFQRNVSSCFDEEAMGLIRQGINPLRFPGLRLSITSSESKAINFDHTPKVIISASGMCEAGRIRHHLKHNLWRAESTVLFVGYQANGTLGRMLVDGAREVRLFGETIEVRSKIHTLKGISGHADKDGLIDWLQGFKKKPDRVFVVHGESSVCDAFAEYLQKEQGMSTFAPYSGACIDLLTGEVVYEASPVPVKRKVRTTPDVFSRLMAAGQRLLAVIKKNEGAANKDLARFADQINSLCDKWDR
ncbi:MBL fold metallo-hydrolase RNA specificity domain-containing protein [Kineothrix sp. MB12-C1]|uniref:MBL fold metallo-hydrolase RNA specificity domain-containing protein n=1 Tax=Kineothrix sp. MB12-C1 TaxID=3070215 RepID=UPI0027D20206|nr:MBL fold metallo-hydrolase [Kineothrix sp. MB12-C1]WMC92030.1 MBL fold metallo-hydrolase [Kineothrix sp. MB12-C1]